MDLLQELHTYTVTPFVLFTCELNATQLRGQKLKKKLTVMGRLIAVDCFWSEKEENSPLQTDMTLDAQACQKNTLMIYFMQSVQFIFLPSFLKCLMKKNFIA